MTALTQCTEENLPQEVPTFLVAEPIIENTSKRYRCPGGKVFNQTDNSVVNYFEIKCEDSQWETIETWPTEDDCIPGDSCSITDITG